MIPKFHYSAEFRESAIQLNAARPPAWAGLVAAREYLREFQRSALAPDVRWHIAQSEFAQHCGEIRWPNPEDQAEHPDSALRGLFVAHPTNEWYVFTLLGNKATGPLRGDTWYESAVPLSDRIARQAISVLGLTPFTYE